MFSPPAPGALGNTVSVHGRPQRLRFFLLFNEGSPFTAYSQQTSLQPGYLSPLNVRFKREIKFILFIHSTRPPCPSFLSLRLPPYLVPFSSTSSSTIRGMKTRRREVVRRGMEAEGRRLPGDASWVELVPGHSSGGPFKLLAKMTWAKWTFELLPSFSGNGEWVRRPVKGF